MSMLDSHVVAYLPAKHRTHCAKLDPFGGACTCGATRVPLVRKSDADAAIAAARQAPATPAAQPADEREAFEAWAVRHGFELLRDVDGEYDAGSTADAWLTWQARAALGSQG